MQNLASKYYAYFHDRGCVPTLRPCLSTPLRVRGIGTRSALEALSIVRFLADRTNGRAIGTVLRPSVCRRRRL